MTDTRKTLLNSIRDSECPLENNLKGSSNLPRWPRSGEKGVQVQFLMIWVFGNN